MNIYFIYLVNKYILFVFIYNIIIIILFYNFHQNFLFLCVIYFIILYVQTDILDYVYLDISIIYIVLRWFIMNMSPVFVSYLFIYLSNFVRFIKFPLIIFLAYSLTHKHICSNKIEQKSRCKIYTSAYKLMFGLALL